MSLAPDEPPPELVEIPLTELAPETLQALVESFVLREGTDYGAQEVPLATKVGQVVKQLQRGEARIVFDPATESVDIRRVLGK
jgi:uncharacterized protein YheU (UPF0270 family)